MKIQDLRFELKQNADAKTKESGERFFKEKIDLYGVKSATVNQIANKYFKEIKDKSKKEIFGFCEELFRSGICEEAFIAASWVYKINKQYEPSDFKIFERWIDKYIDNWAKCDSFCNHTVGEFVEQFPGFIPKIIQWTKSKNRWLKRAAAVSFIVPAKKGKFLKDVFEIADILLLDPDDMAQKGYGWALKAAAQKHEKEVFNYVMKNKQNMPRTALRYAIEKMSRELKTKAMQK